MLFKKSWSLIWLYVVFISGILISPAPAAENGAVVTAATDKLAYRQGETIQITFTNNSAESIFSHIRSGTPVFCIEHIEFTAPGEQPEKLFSHCQYPHCTYDIDAPGEIKSGESEVFGWKPLVFIGGTSETALPEPGTYRLAIAYEGSAKLKWESVYTNQFTLSHEEEK